MLLEFGGLQLDSGGRMVTGIPHAIVEVLSRWDDSELPIGRGETDDAGRIVIDLPKLGLLPDAALAPMRLDVRARAAGHLVGHVMDLTTDYLLRPPHDLGRELTVHPGHNVVGRVVNEDGRSLSGVGVCLRGARGTWRQARLARVVEVEGGRLYDGGGTRGTWGTATPSGSRGLRRRRGGCRPSTPG